MKKLFLLITLSIVLAYALPIYASFSIITTDYFFFQNKHTNEQKYIEIRGYRSRFFFNYYILRYINGTEIGGDSKLQDWYLVRVEEKIEDYAHRDNSPGIMIHLSGSIRVGDYGIAFENSTDGTLSDIKNFKKFTFQDISTTEKEKILSTMFFDFFGIWFFLLLPLNIVIFFCGGYVLFRIYEEKDWGIFKYVYFNSFVVYLGIYSLLIYSGWSFLEISSYAGLGALMYFPLLVLVKLIIFSVSFGLFKAYHKKYPERKVIYKKIGYAYVGFLSLAFIIFHIYNHLIY